ncbi:hypothetical protein FPV67DRAFT_1478596 [Lyophyllum atratum]|nr:hypothetical protein FPV67DRAFT_1478596 [Lyophyllum atratum]
MCGALDDSSIMRALNSLPLDDDIIDRILTFLPDYSTLRMTILSSKSFYNVFKVHPNSILRAVSYNLVGPALPQAIRVLRYSPQDSDTQTNPLMTPPSRPWDESDPVSPISNEECSQLETNAEVVNALEDLFSSRHKDRTSQTSKLNSMESWRFRRAMYRAMLFAETFPVLVDEEEDFDDSEPEADELLKAKLQRKKFLKEFSNYHLRELRSATLFLKEVVNWASLAGGSYFDPLNMGDLATARGPRLVLEAYRAKSNDDLVEHPMLADGSMPPMIEGYLTDPLNEVWEARKEKPPPDDHKHWNSILDSEQGEQDTCHMCSNYQGSELWNEANWEYLMGASHSLALSALPNLVKGSLAHSISDGPALRTRINDPTFSYTDLLEEIHQVRTPPYDSWNKQDWLCTACTIAVIRDHLHLWLLERKRESGEQIPEDCWYGYNCRTQTHKLYHATRVNHLCEPTR